MLNIEDIKSIKIEAHDDDEVSEMLYDFINEAGLETIMLTTEQIELSFKNMCKKYFVHPSKFQLRRIYDKYYQVIRLNNNFKRWLIKRACRSESGVNVVTIVTKPGNDIKFSCPEKCAYCPTETDLAEKPTQPKSYISSEPAMLRALQSNFEIKGQINDRIKSYLYTGNIKNNKQKKKMEVILSGGTWDVMPKDYRDTVINQLYWSFNIYGQETREMLSLEEEKKINETALFGVIGLSIETRPDYVTEMTVKQYLKYGVTRVQIGVQSFDDMILKKIDRGCYLKDTIKAIRLLKMVGLKVVIHLMPDLPWSSKKKDIDMFKMAIENPNLQFDDIKIYPTAVIKSSSKDLIVKSKISDWYNLGLYKPYAENNIEDLIEACMYYKLNVKPWVRIERLIRDIPVQSLDAGYKKMSNLRQVILDRMKKNNQKCNCIRCMEIRNRSELLPYTKLVVRKYVASEGIEYFITYEVEKKYWTIKYIIYLLVYYIFIIFGKKVYYSGDDKSYIALVGFLRLRIDPTPGGDFVPELKNAGLIREVHVYGLSTEVGNYNILSAQHKGYGKLLINTAEEIIKSHNLNKVAIIAGIGSRKYYENKCGYSLQGSYMIKKI